VITHDQVGGDEDLAREVLIIGRSIAPCLSSFADNSEEQKDALAILKRVYAECVARGLRFVKGQSIGPARIEYREVASAFDGDPRAALRALCTPSATDGGSQASFPAERPLSGFWPETYR
jgi:hypothetical protein